MRGLVGCVVACGVDICEAAFVVEAEFAGSGPFARSADRCMAGLGARGESLRRRVGCGQRLVV